MFDQVRILLRERLVLFNKELFDAGNTLRRSLDELASLDRWDKSEQNLWHVYLPACTARVRP